MFRLINPRGTAEMFHVSDILTEQPLSAPPFNERQLFRFAQMAVFGNLFSFLFFPFNNATQFRQWRFRRFRNLDASNNSQEFRRCQLRNDQHHWLRNLSKVNTLVTKADGTNGRISFGQSRRDNPHMLRKKNRLGELLKINVYSPSDFVPCLTDVSEFVRSRRCLTMRSRHSKPLNCSIG
jgi:hypothetical protein